jgi:hypothetical protein
VEPLEAILPDGTLQVVVHYSLATPDGERIACSPSLTQLSAGYNRPVPYHRSAEPTAVTCRECKETEEYKQGLAQVRAGRGRPVR